MPKTSFSGFKLAPWASAQILIHDSKESDHSLVTQWQHCAESSWCWISNTVAFGKEDTDESHSASLFTLYGSLLRVKLATQISWKINRREAKKLWIFTMHAQLWQGPFKMSRLLVKWEKQISASIILKNTVQNYMHCKMSGHLAFRILTEVAMTTNKQIQ